MATRDTKDTKAAAAYDKAHTLVFSAEADKALSRIQQKLAKRIVAALETIAADPFSQHRAAKALTGAKDAFRLRVGDWRALYRIERGSKRVYVVDVLKREEAYR